MLTKNLKQTAQEAYDIVKYVCDQVLDTEEQNEQWFLDWLDSINEQSTRY